MRLSAFHPVTALVYFVAVLVITMFCFSPAVAVCSAVGAFLFCAVTQSRRQFLSDLLFYAFITAVLTITNPLFSHKGVTPLFFINGKAYTKEALFYGFTAGLSLTAVIMWCKVLGKVLTREKMLYIFGRKTPKAALVITMTMGFIPKLKRLHRQLIDALNCSGANISDSRFDRLKKDCTVFTALCAGVLERGADTAASMKARGYGVEKRSFAHSFRFRPWDGVLTAIFSALFVAVLMFSADGQLSADFYPVIKVHSSVLPAAMFALLCICPFILEVKESIKWKYCLAKM